LKEFFQAQLVRFFAGGACGLFLSTMDVLFSDKRQLPRVDRQAVAVLDTSLYRIK